MDPEAEAGNLADHDRVGKSLSGPKIHFPGQEFIREENEMSLWKMNFERSDLDCSATLSAPAPGSHCGVPLPTVRYFNEVSGGPKSHTAVVLRLA